MDTYNYWQRQTAGTPIFPDVEWNKPEQRAHANKLGIVGGNRLGFLAAAETYGEAIASGAGSVRVLLPDVLRKTIPPNMSDVVFGATNPSGSLAKDAEQELHALGEWADAILLVGDSGKNSETAILYEHFLHQYKGQLVITRDAVDLSLNSASALVERPDTLLVLSFAQLQKLFQAVYYPKVLTFSMQLAQLVESLHKFTTTYPLCIVVLHADNLITAFDGNVVTQPWDNPMALWRGALTAKLTVTLLWDPSRPLEQVSYAIANNS